MATLHQDAVGADDGSDSPTTKRLRHQASGPHDTYVLPPRPHLLSAPAPVHNSQLNVQSLYQLQLPHAPAAHQALSGGGQPGPGMMQLPLQLDADHQHQLHLAEKHTLDRVDSPEPGLPASTDYRHKQRRKATERPSGLDQMRQAFSKRKRGLALKCYQLHKLTDAKVFCFIMNEKGTSWAYATPGFGASLSKSSLAHMRSLTGFEQPADVSKQMTDLIPHPTAGDTDDREAYTSAVQPADTAPSAILVGGPEYDAEPDVVDSGTTRDVGVQVSSHLQTVYPTMPEGHSAASDAQTAPDAVRNIVADLAHLAYSRGLPESLSANAPAAQPDSMAAGVPPPQLMQQAMMTVPVHLVPGHPNFDQHAYQLLLQQQQQQQHQLQEQQSQEPQHQQQQQQQHQPHQQHQQQQQPHQHQEPPHQHRYEAHQQHRHDGMQTEDQRNNVASMPNAQHAMPASQLPEEVFKQEHQAVSTAARQE